jgi:hypothetical protein
MEVVEPQVHMRFWSRTSATEKKFVTFFSAKYDLPNSEGKFQTSGSELKSGTTSRLEQGIAWVFAEGIASGHVLRWLSLYVW